MKIETREETIKRNFYISCDGVSFNTEDECLYHEYMVRKDRLQCYNDECAKCDFDICTYIKIVTESDIEDVLEVCKYDGMKCDGLTEPGIYMYDPYSHTSENWINITKVAATIYGGTTNDQT